MKRLPVNINKNLIPIFAAIVIGLISAFALKKIFDKRIHDATSSEKQAFVVANFDVEADTVISADNFSSRSIPVEWAHSNAVLADDFNLVAGKKTKIPLKRGEALFHQAVESDGIKEITQLIPVGRRALTIPVDDQSSISSMLKPGDVIDLILTIQKHNKYKTFPLMEGAKILATGNILDASGLGVDQYGSSSSYTTITLDVSIDDSQNIIQASNLGKITAVLRNPEDQTFSSARLISLEEDKPKTQSVKQQPKQPNLNEAEMEKRFEDMLQALLGDQLQPHPKKPQSDNKKDNSGVNLIYGNS